MTISKKPRGSAVSFLLMQGREVAASRFKAHCLEIMDEVARLGIEVVITKHRKPVARLSPYSGTPKKFTGSLRGTIVEAHDIVSPIGDEWTADESHFT